MPEERSQQLYIAVLLYESTSESGGKKPLYEESFVLIQATSEEEARARAADHARRQEARYENAEGEHIRYSLKHVVDVSPVLDGDLKDGAELYARHFRDYGAYHAFEPLLGGSVD
ncbi:MAG TPA: DUF4288 domain-containing protein [Archangium sp.]|uniref:DUF4288 domain-containing protein n=1 Tax=Archangium sp. TaxID=1872627 RepID=UPI002E339206|nr:DUF4288 domain-containing protein [Archangium sp.]HEX5745004.1 DUF4288 domain-containing protein [Archangium sp.]